MPMRARALRSSFIPVFLLVVAAVLTLGPLGGVAIAAPDPSAKLAKEAFSEGQAAFNLGQFDKAVEAWQRGYKLKPDPVFLYNIAQAYRKQGNLEQAIFFYKSFLHNTSNAPNRDEVVGWIDQLEKQMADERQRKAEEDKRKAEEEERRRREDEDRRRREEEAARAAQAPPPPRPLRGDLGLRFGVNLWAAGLSQSRKPSAAVELDGGYTLVDKGRLRFRLGAVIAFSYVIDLNGKPVNLLGLMVEPTLKVDLWRKKLFFFVDLGLGAGLVTGIPANTATALLHPGKGTDGGAFASFELRPDVGIEYVPIRRLSVLLAPGLAVTTPPTKDFSTEVRVQILAGLAVHL